MSRDDAPPSRLAAAGRAAGYSVLFLVVYGGTNWITAKRSDVGTWCYAFESYIPFVPWTIVPYWSIDLLFVGAFFLCSRRRELDVLGRRVAFAIVVAGACFLAFPLRICFPRPEVAGWFGALFDVLRGFDQPFNLFPSLHICLRTILADTYVRHTSGLLQWGVHGWFSLIGFSTLLTYQHQVVDVLGGFVLAAFCFYAVREPRWQGWSEGNATVGAYYLAGALACALLAWLLWPWGALFSWPGLSLLLVALAYFRVVPSVFRKERGKIPLSAQLIHLPVLFGQRLSLLHYRRKCNPWDEVVPGVWIGRQLGESEAAESVRRGVAAVLDLTMEFTEPPAFRALRYRNVPILDLTAPSPDRIEEALSFIAEESSRGVVYVHCKIGYSRTAAIAGSYLVASGRAATAADAVEILRKARPSLVVRPEAFQAIRDRTSPVARVHSRDS